MRSAQLMRAICVAMVLSLLNADPTHAAVTVQIDTSANARPLSPGIFGVSYADPARIAVAGYTMNRWGGNNTTRYNWRVDVHSTAADWFFENIPGATDRSQVPPLGNNADSFIAATRAGGAQPLMTIPTIGWTPRNDSPLTHPYFAGFSVIKYGAQQSTDPWDADAGNGIRPDSTPITNNDPTDTSTAVTPPFWTPWIAHFQARYGMAATGGVRHYALDNEIMLWNSTHRDVHPGATTYAEAWSTAQAYGAMIKQQEPQALIFGPVTWGYCDLFGSAADNCLDGSDRQAHGGMAFVAWYLQQVCTNPLAGGARVVDVLDLHYYPQGNNVALSNDDTAATAARRLRSLKELYRADWVSESWLADLGDADANHYSKPNLIPRVRGWIDQYCPGTKLAITEYNWGNDGTVSGAVAQAELFGIFAREGVDYAMRWTAPAANSKVESAFMLLRNFDGSGGKVEGSSVKAISADVDQIGAYAFRSNARTFVLLTNKTTTTQDVALSFAQAPGSAWRLFGFDGTHAVQALGNGNLSGAALTLTALPAMSANLLVIEGPDRIFANGFE